MKTLNKQIVLVTSGQPSANPRMLKVAIALANAQYLVKVIYAPLSPWADEFDKNLFSKNTNIDWVRIGYHPQKNSKKHYFARVRMKLYHYLFLLFGDFLNAAIRSHVLFSQELQKEACKHPAALYIGHNLGALPAIVSAAKKYGTQCLFDFEDYHPGEFVTGTLGYLRVLCVQNKFLSTVNYATAASPLIADQYRLLHPTIKIYTINNCFNLSYSPLNFDHVTLPQLPLKLFWFSQFVGSRRGLETVIEAMSLMPENSVSLSLLGNCSEEIKGYFLALIDNKKLNRNQVCFLLPLNEKDIPSLASQHHIGLACEDDFLFNREICLTNKIFMYLLAGIAIVYTDTKAQMMFHHEHPYVGSVFKRSNAGELADILKKYIANPEILLQQQIESAKLALEKYNWEKESVQLIDLLNNLTAHA